MHVQRSRANRVERSWFHGALLALAVVFVLVVPLGNPGSGTAVNLHRIDAAAEVRADHHAKTLPSVSAVAAVAALLVAVGMAVGILRRPTPTLASPPWARHEAVDEGRPAGLRSVFGRAAVARRGPPARA